MTDAPLRVTRRRLLGSFVTVAGASAASGAGTMAMFSDSETSSGNTIQAGTLNLKLGGNHETVEFLNRTNLEPSDEPEEPATLSVRNTGSVPGYLVVEVASIDGELREYLQVKAEFDKRGALREEGFMPASEFLVPGQRYSVTEEFGQTESDTFEFSWHLPPYTDSEAEGKSLEFTLRFLLTQHLDSGT